MANNTRKISELSSKGIVPESALLPVAVAGAEKETYRTTLNNLRANLLFENAYETLAEGIAATVKDEIFYVYTDESQFYVAAFTNVNGASATALYKDNTPVIYGTGKMMADGKFGSYTSYVSYLYNNGSANGGETEIALPFDCFDVSEMFLNGGHQFKGLNYTFDRLSNKVKLKGPLTAGAFVVFYVRPYPGTPVTPVEPGITDYVNVTWLYNDGAAVGGETSLTPPWTFSTVPAIYINGSKQVLNKHYEVDSTGLKINLSKALKANDVVEVILGGSRSVITAQVSGTPAEILLTLGQTTGATKVNTSYGVSLEQVVQGFYGVNSFDDLRNRRPNFDGEKVNLKGYYAGGTSGGGEFIGRLGTATDDGGTVAAGNGFYWERFVNDFVTPQMFGAKLDSVADDAIYVQLAINYITSKLPKVLTLFFPAGNYFFSTPITVTKGPVSWRGAGRDSTIFQPHSSAGSSNYNYQPFISITNPAWASNSVGRIGPFTLSDFSFKGGASIPRQIVYIGGAGFNGLISNIDIIAAGLSAWVFEDVWDTVMIACMVQNCGRIHNPNNEQDIFTHAIMMRSKYDNTNAFRLLGCHLEGNRTGAISISGRSNNIIIGAMCKFEVNSNANDAGFAYPVISIDGPLVEAVKIENVFVSHPATVQQYFLSSNGRNISLRGGSYMSPSDLAGYTGRKWFRIHRDNWDASTRCQGAIIDIDSINIDGLGDLDSGTAAPILIQNDASIKINAVRLARGMKCFDIRWNCSIQIASLVNFGTTTSSDLTYKASIFNIPVTSDVTVDIKVDYVTGNGTNTLIVNSDISANTRRASNFYFGYRASINGSLRTISSGYDPIPYIGSGELLSCSGQVNNIKVAKVGTTLTVLCNSTSDCLISTGTGANIYLSSDVSGKSLITLMSTNYTFRQGWVEINRVSAL